MALLGARIGGQLGLNGATLTSGSYPLDLGCGTLRVPESLTDKFDGVALIADGLRVDQDMLCRDGFRAEGKVRLRGAHIGGELSFDGARLAKGLAANRLRVDQDMLCRGG
ncbi:MAG TPA: hypothetical protein VFX51_30260, partial [Solirubrobacteraceae bacterium]|nr:hypothetical protein [Solirubrobacteraceae bacterium]